MAEPGDPKGPSAPSTDPHDHDAHVGFVSPSSLAGKPRVTSPSAEEAAADRDLFDPPPPRDEPAPFDRSRSPTAPRSAPFAVRSQEDAAAVAEPPAARASDPSSTVQPAPAAVIRQRMAQSSEPPTAPIAPMSLYAVYVLILLAVPTLGVSALVGLLAVTRRDAPRDGLAASHFIYQQRTLLAAAAAAAAGAVLVMVNVGVFVLFVLAVWVLARGAFGVWKLKNGRAVPNPRHWLF